MIQVSDLAKYNDVASAYSAYQLGHMPEAGGREDQPAILLDAFDVLDASFAEIRHEIEEEHEAKARDT